MVGKYYFLHVNKKMRGNPSSEIEQAIDDAEWVRLRGGELYLVYSDKSAKEIRDLVQPLLSEEDHILVGEFNKGNHSGWLPRVAIDWLKRSRI